ncbi:Uncharacterised protein [Pseudomonas putida]|nr:Uncharacterised protein [Pseudomonas putida]CAB5653977.1 Uncharacterised protein [Pseudomonas putida]CAB5694815.1 Uncharacterised protein [Pseudomonas putida]CAB5706277.1 Uncharacterised protein [Pseudomonas putida]
MDYARIRGKDSGKHLAFEELVCQLARREPQAAGDMIKHRTQLKAC